MAAAVAESNPDAAGDVAAALVEANPEAAEEMAEAVAEAKPDAAKKVLQKIHLILMVVEYFKRTIKVI